MIVIVDFIVTVSNTVNLMKLFYAELYEICERDKWSCDSQLKADNKDRLNICIPDLYKSLKLF